MSIMELKDTFTTLVVHHDIGVGKDRDDLNGVLIEEMKKAVPSVAIIGTGDGVSYPSVNHATDVGRLIEAAIMKSLANFKENAYRTGMQKFPVCIPVVLTFSEALCAQQWPKFPTPKNGVQAVLLFRFDMENSTDTEARYEPGSIYFNLCDDVVVETVALLGKRKISFSMRNAKRLMTFVFIAGTSTRPDYYLDVYRDMPLLDVIVEHRGSGVEYGAVTMGAVPEKLKEPDSIFKLTAALNRALKSRDHYFELIKLQKKNSTELPGKLTPEEEQSREFLFRNIVKAALHFLGEYTKFKMLCIKLDSSLTPEERAAYLDLVSKGDEAHSELSKQYLEFTLSAQLRLNHMRAASGLGDGIPSC